MLPAVDRYQSERIDKIAGIARGKGYPFAILSGKYGLIDSRQPIPYYDKLLTEKDIPAAVRKSTLFLEGRSIEKILFLLPDPAVDPHVTPYIKTMEQACAATAIDLEIRFVPPYKDSC